jgi:hypothetical protein
LGLDPAGELLFLVKRILISQQGLGIDDARSSSAARRETPLTYSIAFLNERAHSARALRIPAQHIMGTGYPATRAGGDVRVPEALYPI